MKRVPLTGLVCLIVLSGVLASAARASKEKNQGVTLAESVAQRYGFARWGEVEQLDFVFAVELPDGREIERAWSWRPIERTVVANAGTDEAVTFSLDDITDQTRDHHAGFINDSYWLLFPFQLVWSTCDVAEGGEAEAPISGEPTRKLVVTYPDEGGYTPGDVYELFLDPETGLIAEWNFRRGGGDQGRPATWDGHEQIGPLLISTDHRGPDGSGFRLHFPHIVVTTTDGETHLYSAD